ncbi:MAG: IS982 family transposase [Ktedonobacterales bacterium]|nr:IS982 family transposase [Ktedonobacterales bacterium]
MNLDELIIQWFCMIDDGVTACLGERRLRQRGSTPEMADSEVMTMEIVGEYLGFQQDAAIYRYFRQYYGHFFPAMQHLHRSTFVRQAANIYRLTEQVWQWIREQVPYDHHLGIVDSLALSVCQFTRAPRCRRFRGEAAYGQDHLTRLPFYGFRIQARICWPGVICQFEVTPGNASELEAARDLTQGTSGLLLGDRNFWSPRLKADLADHQIRLLAPFRRRKHDPWPAWSYLLSQWRYRIDTVFGQLVDRTALKRVWAKDFWHLCHRLLRKVLMHTIAVWTTTLLGLPALQLAHLIP